MESGHKTEVKLPGHHEQQDQGHHSCADSCSFLAFKVGVSMVYIILWWYKQRTSHLWLTPVVFQKSNDTFKVGGKQHAGLGKKHNPEG